MDNKYTNREIAIFTDAHALYEPTKAILEDIKRRGITEIYSLGDNIGLGPNPKEVMDLLKEYNVKSIAGNAEEYITLGSEPFLTYFSSLDEFNRIWTKNSLNKEQINEIALFPHSIELLVGGKKLALCHFANDVRCDFMEHSTWRYQLDLKNGLKAYKQFLYTNSDEQIKEINNIITRFGFNSPQVKGYLSANDDPLFRKKRVDYFDAVIQGHVHFKMYEESGKTKFWTIRAVGLGYVNAPRDEASYVIVKEKEKGFDVEEVLIKYNRQKMISNILSSEVDTSKLRKYADINDNDIEKNK